MAFPPKVYRAIYERPLTLASSLFFQLIAFQPHRVIQAQEADFWYETALEGKCF